MINSAISWRLGEDNGLTDIAFFQVRKVILQIRDRTAGSNGFDNHSYGHPHTARCHHKVLHQNIAGLVAMGAVLEIVQGQACRN